MRVTAAVARAHDAPLRIESLDLVEPGPGDILVRLVACGIGRVDELAVSGAIAVSLPFVPGSEGAGIVERVGEGVERVEPGDTVFIDYAACGVCEGCRAGHPRACRDVVRQNLSGRSSERRRPFKTPTGEVGGYFFGQSAFATHLVCAADLAIKLPSEAPLEIVAALGGDVLTGAAAVTDTFRLRPGETIVIAGAGVIGLAACLVAKERGASAIVVADPDERRRVLASECGATVTVHADDELETAITSLTGDGAAFALDTTGREHARRACRTSVRRGGLVGVTRPPWVAPDTTRADDAAGLIQVDRTLAPGTLLPELLDLYAEGRLPIGRIVTYFAFDEVNDALEAMADGRVSKPVLRFALGTFGDLDRAKSEGAVREAPEDVTPDPTDVGAGASDVAVKP